MVPKPHDRVRVTITSDIPELKDKLGKLNQLVVQPSTSWLELLRYHEVPVDTAKHQIKSSRNSCYIDDAIQTTAVQFKHSVLRVQIVNMHKSRPGRPRMANKNRPVAGVGHNARNMTRKVSKTSTPTTSQALPRPSLTASPISHGKSRSGVVSSNLGPTTAARAGTSNIGYTSKIVQPTPSRVGQLLGELNFSAAQGVIGQEAGVLEEDPILGGPAAFIRRADYAESQDSQVDDPQFSVEKRTLLQQFERCRNEDFAEFLKEINKIKAGGEDSRYRWQRKAPLLATLMFNWADRVKK